MKRRVLGIIILAMTVCLCSCGADATSKESGMSQSEENGIGAVSEENDIEISAKEIIKKLDKKDSLNYAKVKISSDVTFLFQSNEDTSFIKNYENKENTYAEISKEEGSYCTIEQEWIGNGEKGVITSNQYLKENKIYYNYVDSSADTASSDVWYVMDSEDIWKNLDNSFVESLTPGEVALTEEGGYILTGTTDPQKGRCFLDMILQYRVKMMDQISLNYELLLDKDFNLIHIKFTLDKPYKETPNAVDEYNENWTVKVITVQSFELECYDINVENEIVLPKAAEGATPIK